MWKDQLIPHFNQLEMADVLRLQLQIARENPEIDKLGIAARAEDHLSVSMSELSHRARHLLPGALVQRAKLWRELGMQCNKLDTASDYFERSARDLADVGVFKRGEIVGYHCRNDEIERLQAAIDSASGGHDP